jgi:hypothetical protein
MERVRVRVNEKKIFANHYDGFRRPSTAKDPGGGKGRLKALEGR